MPLEIGWSTKVHSSHPRHSAYQVPPGIWCNFFQTFFLENIYYFCPPKKNPPLIGKFPPHRGGGRDCPPPIKTAPLEGIFKGRGLAGVPRIRPGSDFSKWSNPKIRTPKFLESKSIFTILHWIRYRRVEFDHQIWNPTLNPTRKKSGSLVYSWNGRERAYPGVAHIPFSEEGWHFCGGFFLKECAPLRGYLLGGRGTFSAVFGHKKLRHPLVFVPPSPAFCPPAGGYPLLSYDQNENYFCLVIIQIIFHVAN